MNGFATCSERTARGTFCKRTGGWTVEGAAHGPKCYQHAVAIADQLCLTTVVGIYRGRVVDITELPSQPRHRGRFTSQRTGAAA